MPIITIDNVVKRTMGERNYFFGSLSSDKVRDVTFVPVIENSPRTPLKEVTEDGYQRPGSQPRMSKFKNFLEDFPMSVVPPVLLSGRGQWKFRAYSGDNSIVGALDVEGSAAILDGQHRLGGYVLLYQKNPDNPDVRNIDFILLDNLSLEEEMQEFVTVNNTQVGVPKSLGAFLGIELSDDENAWIAWELNTREDSPFLGKITRTKIAKTHLFALHSVAKNIERLFKHGAFQNTERGDKADIAIRYWNIIADSHPVIWADIEKLDEDGPGKKAFTYKMLELTGFIAWSLVGGSTILPACYNGATHTTDWERVEAMVGVLTDKIEWNKDGEYAGRTGEVGGKIIATDMETILSENPL